MVSLALIFSFRDASFSSSCWPERGKGLLEWAKAAGALQTGAQDTETAKILLLLICYQKKYMYSLTQTDVFQERVKAFFFHLTVCILLPRCPKVVVSICSWVYWLLR